MAQAKQQFSGKETIGRINLERFKESLRLRWSLEKKRYSLTIGKDCLDTLRVARARAQEIDSDITLNRFDSSLVKYGKRCVTLVIASYTQRTILRGKKIEFNNTRSKDKR